jgi:anthranilate phosphoribosyltransferase
LRSSSYGFSSKNPPWTNLEEASTTIKATIGGESNPLYYALLWNSGFYLWQRAGADSLNAGIEKAREILTSGQVLATLRKLQKMTANHVL